VQNLYDAGSLTVLSYDSNRRTYSGTVSNTVTALGGTTVTIYLGFSGSASGMLSVKNQTLIQVSDLNSNLVSKAADLSFSDVFPGSATPPIPESSFDRAVVGVVPFVFVRNNSLAGVNNITRDQALLLMTASGDGGMPASYLGGIGAEPVYLIGRDSGSGTRITAEKVIGFLGTPLLWATNGTGGFVSTNGYSSGANVKNVVGTTPNTIGYLGLGDASGIVSSATYLSLNGVAFSPTTVANGSYALWGYQHLVNRVGGLSANQKLIRDALIAAIQNDAFQTSNPLYTPNFVPLSSMQVERGADGGVITSLNF
jgi:phosphate transport system substrate-binding protein